MNLPFANDSIPATFLIGGAGAGKTELALNLSVYNAARYGSSTLIDLDIVNPFFRVRRLREDLHERGVSVICPDERVVAGDMPALPAAAWGALEQLDKPVICDIGGGEQGLRPLGRLKDHAEKRKANVFFVINPFRPGFSRPDELAASFNHMVGLSAMKVTHVVANPNLANETTLELFLEGLNQVRDFAEKAGLKLGFAVAASALSAELGAKLDVLPGFFEYEKLPVFALERYWSVPWHFGVAR